MYKNKKKRETCRRRKETETKKRNDQKRGCKRGVKVRENGRHVDEGTQDKSEKRSKKKGVL